MNAHSMCYSSVFALEELVLQASACTACVATLAACLIWQNLCLQKLRHFSGIYEFILHTFLNVKQKTRQLCLNCRHPSCARLGITFTAPFICVMYNQLARRMILITVGCNISWIEASSLQSSLLTTVDGFLLSTNPLSSVPSAEGCKEWRASWEEFNWIELKFLFLSDQPKREQRG